LKRERVFSALAGVLLGLGAAWVQATSTHTVLTNDQTFNVANGRSLTGTYECSGAGTITSCVTALPSGSTLTSPVITTPTITGGTWSGGTWLQGTIGKSFGASGDGVFLCAGSGSPYNDNNCRFNGNYEFNVGGVGSTQFDSGFSANGTNTISSGSLIITTAGTLDIRSAATLLVNSGAVITAVKTVRDSAGTGTCTLTFTKGILTATTC
jgi:hypothetical protein